MNSTINDTATIELKALAKLAGCTRRELRRAITAGYLLAPDDNDEMPVAESVSGLFRFYREAAGRIHENAVAAATGLSKFTLRKLARAGKFNPPKSGFYHISDFLASWTEMLRGGVAAIVSLADVKLAREKAKLALEEIAVKKARGELILESAAVEEVSAPLSLLMRRLQNMPTGEAKILAGQSPEFIERRLADFVRALRTEIAAIPLARAAAREAAQAAAASAPPPEKTATIVATETPPATGTPPGQAQAQAATV